MSDSVRVNEEEFISYLGTCMSFYKMHLTPGEQSHVIPDIADILRDALNPMERDDLVRRLFPGYDITISNTL